MFGNLKKKNDRNSVFINRDHPSSFTRSPGVDSSVTKGNEKRLVRCRVCGWICDTERDVIIKDGSFAGFGINQGQLLTAGTSVGDSRTPAAGTVNTTPDQYYDRTVSAGCPCCGTYSYHPNQKILRFPED
jgi:ribosomal protein L37E